MQKFNTSNVNQQSSLSETNSVVSSSDKMTSVSSYSSSDAPAPDDDQYDLILGLCDFDDLPFREPTAGEKKNLTGMFYLSPFAFHC